MRVDDYLSNLECYDITLHAEKEEKIRFMEENQDQIEQVDCPVTHNFSPGLYIREVHLTAGSQIIGHRHKQDHLNIMIAGKISLQNTDGSYTELSAPLMYTSGPGRKIMYVHDNTVWLNIWATTETDVDILESMFLDKTDEWYKGEAKVKLFIEHIDKEQKEPNELASLPYGRYKMQVSGNRLFANGNIAEGEVIAPARINDKLTIAGFYPKHSGTPNATMKTLDNDHVILIALRDIKGNKGGLKGEEITVDYNRGVTL